jgi:hypothetical protein
VIQSDFAAISAIAVRLRFFTPTRSVIKPLSRKGFAGLALRNTTTSMQERPPAPAAMQGGIDSELLRLISSTALQTKLDTIVGPKTLILTPSLAGPLGLVTEVGLLKVRAAVTVEGGRVRVGVGNLET